MAGLLGAFELGANALFAQNEAISVTGRNAANANTEGFSREIVDLESNRHLGITVGLTRRSEDNLLASREREADGNRGRATTLSTALAAMERNLVGRDNLPGNIAELFGSFMELASAPMDDVRRSQVISKAGALVSTFHDVANSASQARSGSDARLVTWAAAATEAAQEIASANRALGTSPDPMLMDNRDKAARKLAEIMGGQARIDTDGKMRFVLPSGEVLVDGDRAVTIQTVVDASNGNHLAVRAVDGQHVGVLTRSLESGKIAGEIAFRDGTAAQTQQNLDRLAYDLAQSVNLVHAAHAGLDGVAGRNLFVPLGSPTGAAAALQLNPTLTANPRLIAAGTVGLGQTDNQGAVALSALKDQLLAGGNTRTFTDEAIFDLTTVGSATKTAQGQLELESARSDVLKSTRDSISGVSVQEEMTHLASYQHAAEAAQRFIATVNSLFDSMLNKL